MTIPWRWNEGGGVAHEEENIDVMEMSYDEAYDDCVWRN
jgi:hypothetical protein